MSRAQLTSTVEQNTGGAVAPFVGGKNFIINGGMDVWQRGTSSSSSGGYYTADRWYQVSGSVTYSQETSIVPTGFQYALKGTTSASVQVLYGQAIETAHAIRLAGQTVTLSYYGATSDSSSVYFRIDYATTVDQGISSGTWTIINTITKSATPTMPSSPQQATFAIPSNAKTLRVFIGNAGSQASGGTTTITGVQLEVGSVATPFSRAGGTLQGELALCQRYYYQINTPTNLPFTFQGNATMFASVPLPVTMRTAPTGTTNINSFTTSGSPSATQIYLNAYYVGNLSGTYSSATVYSTLPYNVGNIQLYSWSGYTTGLPYLIGSGSSVYVAWSAEL